MMDEAAGARGALHGVRVIEMAGFGPAPFCGMLLADMGADVVRVERANAPERGFPMEPRFEVLNRGRRSIALDLKTDLGRSTLLRLVGKAAILIEGFRPGVMERLGAGPQECLELNPALVYGRVTGYGQDGPMAHMAGHDLNYVALTGALHAVGPANGDPVPPLNLVGDFGGGGMLLAVGVLSAYIEALRSGTGQVVDAAMVDGASLLLASTYGLMAAGYWTDERGSNVLDGGAPWYSVYRSKDGRYVSVAAVEQRFYDELLRILGLDSASLPSRKDKARWPELRRVFAARFAELSSAEIDALLSGSDACYAPVMSLRDAPANAQLQARRTFITVDGVVQPAPAPRFSATRASVRRPPPRPGEHTEEVLREWLE
ncbi:CaiB/BaiF CoA transferase family protein [Yanghanlia caeni]|uniref:CaiB/BaiF CoA-transferase family protein n=1 Tax=Yanghanlia caeni TaxID=3064283 RepID=A0ABU1D855_9BURK|nr:CaiB/BaiF CoA-transferase family protein [Alcaligenaceae bacterium LG-2]HZH55958.1 CaiB/BaiF CoA-transferase family protein [Burkholderiaceae bacterium]